MGWSRIRTFGLYLGIALGVMAGLIAVALPDLGKLVDYKKSFPSGRFTRWDDTVQQWIRNGYFHDGGMIYVNRDLTRNFYPDSMPEESLTTPQTVFPWRNATGLVFVPIFVVEKTIVALGYPYSYRAMVLYGLVLVAIAGACLAMLSMKIASHLGATPLRAFILGAAALIVFQTFPINLWIVWEPHWFIALIGFAALFLSVEFGRWSMPRTMGAVVLRCMLASAVVLQEPVTGGFFLVTYVLVRAAMEERGASAADITTVLIVPLLITGAFMQMQHLLVRSNYASVFFVGSSVPFRSGFDGSRQYFVDHWDILLRNYLKAGNPLATLTWWPTLLLAGLVSAVAILARYRQHPALREPTKILLATLGLYIPFVMLFAQAAVIHPYVWDLCLVVPCILAAFVMLPAWFEGRTSTGIPTLAAAAISFGYAMVQVRTFTLVFPALP